MPGKGRTKLEHYLLQCYMWITGAASRDRGECGAVERIGSLISVDGRPETGLGLSESLSGK